MIFSNELLTSILPELQEMFWQNNEETGMLGQESFDPDVDKYLAMEAMGVAKLFIARAEGKLVGYCMMLVMPHPHYKKTVVAFQDVLFMVSERRGIGSVRFIKWIDEFCRSLGADNISRTVSSKKDFSRTLMRMGYEEVETSYVRRCHE
jgi:hypothetical protein